MTERRTLADMLIDVADGVLGVAMPPGLRATSMELSLPVEVEIVRTSRGAELRAELPRFVRRTSFDRSPSRLTVRWKEGSAP
jgi:hypothetical protein